jgi:Zn-finger nucleic acid-binding protein
MQCPVCSVELRMTDRQGVEIDYCPQCRGVWLDRGELDKLIERSATSAVARESDDRPPRPRDYDDRPRDSDRPREYRDRDDDYHKKKRKGWLGEIFDFD